MENILQENMKRFGTKNLNEATTGLEPVIDTDKVVSKLTSKPGGIELQFEEGQGKLSDEDKNRGVNVIMKDLEQSLPTIEKYFGTGKLPKFITIGVGTSSTGTRDRNAQLARLRINELKNLIFMAFEKIGNETGKFVGRDTIESLITNKTGSSYKPSSLNPIYDRSKSRPEDAERVGFIEIRPLTIKGLETIDIDNVADRLRYAKGMNINPDEKLIATQIERLQTYSDITDLNRELRDHGGLEDFINSTITDGRTRMGSDIEERLRIVRAINKAAKRSGKDPIARIVGSFGNQMVSLGL